MTPGSSSPGGADGNAQPAAGGRSARFEEGASADIVAGSFADTTDARLRTILTSLTEHLHAFVKEVGLTVDEWAGGIAFLTEAGHACTDTRQELVLLSDVLGISMLVETVNNRAGNGLTESTVEGPFHVVGSPRRSCGDRIDLRGAGEPCLVTGRVVDQLGSPVVGASVDIWQADADGYYDVQRPGEVPEGHLRGLFTTDGDGAFWFRSVVPRYYPIPTDGPVGRLLAATGRHPFRPAHIHVEVTAPGVRTLTTHLFVAGDPYLESDAVFGVKDSLVHVFATVDDPIRAEEVGLPNPFRHVDTVLVVRRRDQ